MLAGGAAGCRPADDETASGPVPRHVLELALETQNLRFLEATLEPESELAVCAELTGELRYGSIPFRLPGEGATSNERFFRFAAAYGSAAMPDVVLDLDQDGNLGCDERIPLIAHPEHPERAFRSLELFAGGDDSSRDSSRYRLILPVGLAAPGEDLYQLDLIDVPVGRWQVDGRDTLWILYDGNHDGVFDGRFGDGLLADLTGERQISTDPYGGHFFSLHLPLSLPWGTFEVADLDPRGSSLTLVRVPDEAAESLRPLRIGDFSRPRSCDDPSGVTVTLGGPSGAHQLLYFWLSHCGACAVEMAELIPLVEQLGQERLAAVGISLDENAEAFSGFVDAQQPPWPQCFPGTGPWDNPLARGFGVTGPSEFVLIDPEGKVAARDRGMPALRRQLAEIFPELRDDPLFGPAFDG